MLHNRPCYHVWLCLLKIYSVNFPGSLETTEFAQAEVRNNKIESFWNKKWKSSLNDPDFFICDSLNVDRS